ncbi:hypothetical protein [Methanobrevibacter filiformis]|uniref:DUF4325 domain-containing protein n=1 Tax=Methanobrevibacter filiformis TaxID=55758 RepID=A0A166F445_9EURY|nr:hypothetical protein [Methanobrevibacter filiformis]KZX17292.1 hypothetical protein MBFIL_02530 [Methanobrevibacter filiformis]
MINEIKLADTINSNLGMRFAAEDLFNNLINDAPEIVMNFENVNFMSRSFAQEYVYQKEKNNSITIIEKNMPQNVKEMINIVISSLDD